MSEQAPSTRRRPALVPAQRRRSGREILARVPEWAALSSCWAPVVFFSIKSPYFFDADNFINILIASSVVGIIACPATMLLIAGQFDPRSAGGRARDGDLRASFVDGDRSLVSVADRGRGRHRHRGAERLPGTVVGVNALITTIGTLGAMRAFAYIRTDGQAIGFEGFTTLGIYRPILNIPWMVWIFVLTVFD